MVKEATVVFLSLIEDIQNQSKRFPDMNKIEITEKFFSEKHEIAWRFYRLHQEILKGGLSSWRKNGFMKEDFELLFEQIERGYAQRIGGFDTLLKMFEYIRDLGNPESFQVTRWEKVTCEDCDGTGGTYVDGKCLTCNGRGLVQEEIVFEGKGEKDYYHILDTQNKNYLKMEEENRFKYYEEYLNRLEEENLDIEKALESHKRKEKLKPSCKWVGEDGNVFNLLALSYRALEKEGLKEEAEKMQERVWASASYDEALQTMLGYVDVY